MAHDLRHLQLQHENLDLYAGHLRALSAQLGPRSRHLGVCPCGAPLNSARTHAAVETSSAPCSPLRSGAVEVLLMRRSRALLGRRKGAALRAALAPLERHPCAVVSPLRAQHRTPRWVSIVPARGRQMFSGCTPRECCQHTQWPCLPFLLELGRTLVMLAVALCRPISAE